MSANQDQIKAVLLGREDDAVRLCFVQRYGGLIDEFISIMAKVFDAGTALDNELSTNEQGAFVAALFYASINSHVISMKLLMGGLIVPSGSTYRYVLESLSMSLLLSKPSLGFFARYKKGRYSPSKAVQHVIRNYKALGLERKSLATLEAAEKFYHKFSHASVLSLGQIITYNENNPKQVLGGCYDSEKEVAYNKEFSSRVNFARILPGVAHGIRRNYATDV